MLRWSWRIIDEVWASRHDNTYNPLPYPTGDVAKQRGIFNLGREGVECVSGIKVGYAA